MINTKRLIIRPLTYNQLVKYAKCDNSLEKELNVNPNSRIISDELKEALENTIIPNVADKNKNYLFSTLWTAISIAENLMVGDICIYGEPNELGEIEIGYGTYNAYQNKGYMTEIVGGIIEWLKTNSLVKSVIASTEKSNVASFKVLQKNGFVKSDEDATLIYWKLDFLKR